MARGKEPVVDGDTHLQREVADGCLLLRVDDDGVNRVQDANSWREGESRDRMHFSMSHFRL